MLKALTVAAGLALTSYPALAHDGAVNRGDGNSIYEAQRGGDDGGARPYWRDGDQDGPRQNWDDRGRDWRPAEEMGRRGDAERSGGAAFRLKQGDVRLSVRCGDADTISACMSAAAALLDAARGAHRDHAANPPEHAAPATPDGAPNGAPSNPPKQL